MLTPLVLSLMLGNNLAAAGAIFVAWQVSAWKEHAGGAGPS